jgi:hypothetical protein
VKQISDQIEREVLRRAGGRCEGRIEDPRMKLPSERCEAKGTDDEPLEFVVSFWAEMADAPITATDVSLLCAECYAESETAHEWDHWDYLMSKDD